ncbi:hypothetical protein H4R33_004484, partial [Dimargaris cristalligena]
PEDQYEYPFGVEQDGEHRLVPKHLQHTVSAASSSTSSTVANTKLPRYNEGYAMDSNHPMLINPNLLYIDPDENQFSGPIWLKPPNDAPRNSLLLPVSPVAAISTHNAPVVEEYQKPHRPHLNPSFKSGPPGRFSEFPEAQGTHSWLAPTPLNFPAGSSGAYSEYAPNPIGQGPYDDSHLDMLSQWLPDPVGLSTTP